MMKDAKHRFAHLALVGLSMAWSGCGGSDVPDPSSDPTAASESPSMPTAPSPPPAEGEAVAQAAPTESPESAPAPAPASALVARANRNRPAPERADGERSGSSDTATPAVEPDATPTPAATETAAKGDSTGTTDLLALGSTAAPAAAPTPAAKSDDSGGSPGGPGPMAQLPGGGGGGRRGALMGGGGPGGGGPGTMDEGGMAARGGGMPGRGGMMGGSGGGMTGAADNAPASFVDPIRGCQTFLGAVKSKDKDRIKEATALRSASKEENPNVKNREMFAKILDLSVGDDTIDELAKALEGFTIVDTNQAKTTGRFGVILGKSDNKGGQFRRTIIMRKEAAGWKTFDISGQSDLEALPGFRNNRTTTRNR